MYDMRIIHKDKKEMERVNKIKERLYNLSLTSFGSKKHELVVA
jgi:hypothetical protein